MRKDYALIVFSHLRWDFVYQRPQHLLSRMAANHRVIFIEEPIYKKGIEPQWTTSEPENNVLVCQAIIPTLGGAFGNEQTEMLAPMVRDLMEREGITDYVAWFYTPMALPLLHLIKPEPLAVVFDCMDELSAFKGAPKPLLEREAKLLIEADLVFTGGRSLYEAKKDRNPKVFCLPSSVDAKHFSASKTMPEAEDMHGIPHPRLGFYGVIDERMDLDLLDSIAKARPEWQLVIVGPIAKIEKTSLPVHSNIHYLGPKTYGELPSYLAGWDVCLLPFALNESTRFISPTKTLEYMAAELPIISTPIKDVEGSYSNIVYLAGTPAEFIAACETALNASADERQARSEAMREVLSTTSWDSTANQMQDLIEQAIEEKQGNQTTRGTVTGANETPGSDYSGHTARAATSRSSLDVAAHSAS